MNKFQYQLYSNKIESLKGTKQPLKNLAKEIYKIRDTSTTHIQLLYQKCILIRNIEKYSSAVNPLLKEIESSIKYNENNLLTSKDITLEQFNVMYPYTNTYISFYPKHLSELNLINDKMSVFNETQYCHFSCDNIKELTNFHNKKIAAYLYVKAVIGDSPLLQKIKITLSSNDLKEIKQNLDEQLNILNTIK